LRSLGHSGRTPGVCEECGAVDDGLRGWTLRLDDGDVPVVFCPDCDERVFGDSERRLGPFTLAM